MALTGLDIYKHLPKTNCRKCGFPTCLAFAMQIAAKKASLEQCPDISEEAKLILSEASAPPIRLVTIGTGENKVEVGGETVLFRHEKTFYYPTAVAVAVSDNLEKDGLERRLENIKKLDFERVGQRIGVNLIAVKNESNDPNKFGDAVGHVAEKTKLPFILMSQSPASIEAGLGVVRKALIYSADENNYQDMVNMAKKYETPLVVRAKGVEDAAVLSQKISSMNFKDIVIDFCPSDIGGCLQDLTTVRRLALKKNYRPLGYPVMTVVNSGNPYEELARAATYIAKYSSIVVLEGDQPWEVLPLLTLRQNIFTDPQKPVAVEPKLYEIGGAAGPASPLLVTTNFSLTFFSVSPEIEASKMPSYLLVVDSEGMSVLTAWAAEKLTPEKIAGAMKDSKIEEKVQHKKVIIPGYVAVMSGKLEDLTGWQIIVGPREASGIPKFLKTTWQ